MFIGMSGYLLGPQVVALNTVCKIERDVVENKHNMGDIRPVQTTAS